MGESKVAKVISIRVSMGKREEAGLKVCGMVSILMDKGLNSTQAKKRMAKDHRILSPLHLW